MKTFLQNKQHESFIGTQISTWMIKGYAHGICNFSGFFLKFMSLTDEINHFKNMAFLVYG